MAPSHPSRDAWIEISNFLLMQSGQSRRIPRGMRGLKFVDREIIDTTNIVASLAGCVD